MLLPQLVAFRLQPLVVQLRQQVILIESRCLLQCFSGGREIVFLFGVRCLRYCCLKLAYVDGARVVQPPAYGTVVRYEKRAFDRKRAAQVVDQLPEIRSCLGFV